jgi:hypothetical protein
MTRKEALAELIAMVEAEELEDDDQVRDALRPLGIPYLADRAQQAFAAFEGSLDAAKVLHEAVLHERAFVEIHWSKRYEDESRVTINMGEGGWHAAMGTPARAWLLAILRALHSMEPPHDRPR